MSSGPVAGPSSKRCRNVFSGTRARSSLSLPKLLPLDSNIPMTLNGTLLIRTICPIGSNDPNNLLATVTPKTTTRDPELTSPSSTMRPTSALTLDTMAYSGVTPITCVVALLPDTTNCAVERSCGAAANTPGICFFMARISRSVRRPRTVGGPLP